MKKPIVLRNGKPCISGRSLVGWVRDSAVSAAISTVGCPQARPFTVSRCLAAAVSSANMHWEKEKRLTVHLVHLGLYVWGPKCGRERWKTSFLSWWGQTAWIGRNCRETKNLQITGFWRCWNIGWFVRLEPYLDMGKVKWGRTHLFFWGAHLGLCSILLTFQTFVP